MEFSIFIGIKPTKNGFNRRIGQLTKLAFFYSEFVLDYK